MSSILTNTSAMTALSTLRGVNKGLELAQQQISTGKRVAGANDNASMWSISALMTSDVSGFRAVAESLSLGAATLTVARDGAEAVTEQLALLKQRVIAAQEENVDREKINKDVRQLADQIKATVDASQFNGMNLLKESPFSTDKQINFVASLNRTESGLETSRIYVTKQNLSVDAGKLVPGVLAATTDGVNSTHASAYTFTAPAENGATAYAELGTAAPANATDLVLAAITDDTVLNVAFGEYRVSVKLEKGTSAADAAAAVKDAIDKAAKPDFTTSGTAPTVTVTNNTSGAATLKARASDADTGAFFALHDMNVLTDEDAKRALRDLEPMLQAAVNAAAAFGAAEKRIEVSDTFVGKVADSLTTGVGAITDADMEAASARLQALQVQQQLGVQALSIANQQPQSILALFQG